MNSSPETLTPWPSAGLEGGRGMDVQQRSGPWGMSLVGWARGDHRLSTSPAGALPWDQSGTGKVRCGLWNPQTAHSCCFPLPGTKWWITNAFMLCLSLNFLCWYWSCLTWVVSSSLGFCSQILYRSQAPGYHSLPQKVKNPRVCCTCLRRVKKTSEKKAMIWTEIPVFI